MMEKVGKLYRKALKKLADGFEDFCQREEEVLRQTYAAGRFADQKDGENALEAEDLFSSRRPRSFSSYEYPQGLAYGWGAQLLSGAQAIASLPCLVLPDALFRELHYYFSTSAKEFQIMGFVAQEVGNRFVMTEWVFPPHTAGASHAHLDEDAFPAWLDTLERQGKDIRMLRVQAHSPRVFL